ncbi:acetyl-CoA carboxylase biotin carboxyl carrier protein [Clostridium weizhouense]|uniref:Biotin carboxyl carrier protein of acetyl-CoA carboxylase n=1 Tax=Clostridium weizhouense TaxID=2859781 RepID=A0ABS7AMG3_9CLOT|nr:acetyl-CoA carboxylase biotin carboxyl carrier protein [Clostridium weizhouense]MBW6409847.1 acetyl-CoA carboxylase biotin carboxyl carrier protein [Clostridium weizhouense]
MDFEKIKELINVVNASDLAFFEIKTDESYIKMDKSLTRNLGEVSNNKENVSVRELVDEKIEKVNKQEKKELREELNINKQLENDDLGDATIITSPMVGTFYSSPSPESDPFVNEGDEIKKGQTICIIEAMKLMNEIESDYSGKIIKCFAKDGDMVEYGQKLFAIKGE